MKKHFVVWLIIILVIASAICGVYLWNKPHRKAEDEKGIPVTAFSLMQEYTNNESAANTKYLNKPLKVSGTIYEIDTNQDGQIAILLEAGSPLSTVMCTMRDRNISVKQNDSVVVKGFCSGYVSDIKLTDCILVH